MSHVSASYTAYTMKRMAIPYIVYSLPSLRSRPIEVLFTEQLPDVSVDCNCAVVTSRCFGVLGGSDRQVDLLFCLVAEYVSTPTEPLDYPNSIEVAKN
jgi:hypothetical protein